MNKKIIISSDSTTDLSNELIERYGFKILPLTVTMGGKNYKDGIDIVPQDIYDFHTKTGELPKTSAINISQYTDFFNSINEENSEILFFSFCGKMSSTYCNACLAAEEFDNVHVVDTMNLSTGSALLMLHAADMVKAGKNINEILDSLNKIIPCVDASFVIDNLEYLHEGGRCSGVAVFGANLLKIKPCIEVKDGVMCVGKKFRGKFEQIMKDYVKERLADKKSLDENYVFITHAGISKDIIDELVKYVKSIGVFKEVFVTTAGCTIASHCGQNCMGVLFVRKSPIV